MFSCFVLKVWFNFTDATFEWVNSGYTVTLRQIDGTGNHKVAKFLESNPKNAIYRSKIVQNELIMLCAKQITSNLSNEIEKSGEFAILADEATGTL